ncbi:unnamed protein product [Arctia plantaginis]|uniref:Uncharacterized protein n=1 Tax=Arctia plantaginis TaxID=874455 RepID=A0A8S0ZEQ5_ARCPL|nr:unnamed protein product [Arctia plantaginis]CAB3248129.1 unnamed protein product [Arctia plantaginis]
MNTIMDRQSDTSTSTRISEPTEKQAKIKAASAPIVPITSDAALKHQTSAPSYFHSLKENDAPPFLLPGLEQYPMLVIRHIFNEEDVVEVIANADADKEHGLKKFLGQLLVEKEIIPNFALSEKNFLVSLLAEVIDYAAQRDFNPFKLSVMLTLYVDSHRYFKWYYWLPPIALWNYFKEMMIRHTIEDSPTGQEVFKPEECYDIITHFHTVYLSNLPLIHILTFGAYRLKLVWPFRGK